VLTVDLSNVQSENPNVQRKVSGIENPQPKKGVRYRKPTTRKTLWEMWYLQILIFSCNPYLNVTLYKSRRERRRTTL
jgi:hypothetical protein